jgi:hypothetical protein
VSAEESIGIVARARSEKVLKMVSDIEVRNCLEVDGYDENILNHTKQE